MATPFAERTPAAKSAAIEAALKEARYFVMDDGVVDDQVIAVQYVLPALACRGLWVTLCGQVPDDDFTRAQVCQGIATAVGQVGIAQLPRLYLALTQYGLAIEWAPVIAGPLGWG